MSIIGDQIRVLVVDDSAFMRKVLTDIVNSESAISVVGSAKDGAEAIEKYNMLKPDVVMLDVDMPVMDGMTCLNKLLMIEHVKVLMISTYTQEGSEVAMDAIANGAMDYIAKPQNLFDMTNQNMKNEIIAKLKIIGNNKMSREDLKDGKLRRMTQRSLPKSTKLKKIITIGTSTGGPRALQAVIPLIPADIAAGILIVQHMPPGFTKSLSVRLNNMSPINVKEAQHDDIVLPGCAYIAPGDFHMAVEWTKESTLKIKLTKDPPIGRLRPCVDVMMHSLSDTGLNNIVGVIMTGMGGDGSKGFTKLKEKNNAYLISQDEKSSTVFGMPKEAIATGLVDIVLPLDKIANEIIRVVEEAK